MTESVGVATAAAVALDYADRIVLESARDIHDSVSGRVHGGIDVGLRHKTVAHYAHDAIASTVFTSIGAGLRAGSWMLRKADEIRPMGPPLAASVEGQFFISAMNGLVGSQIADRTPSLDIAMAIRSQGHDVPPEKGNLALAFPEASASIVVFVHGLCENESWWNRPARPDLADSRSYGDRLAEDVGWTPVFIRANTGSAVRVSGVDLHALMSRVVESWPVEVRRIALVGHSMGGLIIRAACDVDHGAAWTDRVSDVITLGTPHLGSPVERSIALGMRVANRVPELAPYRRTFMQRSAGVLDLSEGLPEPSRALPHARYRLVAATLTATTTHPLAIALGDLLVQPRSAFGQPVNGEALFPEADMVHVPHADHFDLLNHEEVYDAMRGWLSQPVLRR